jgi:hypothetical protein
MIPLSTTGSFRHHRRGRGDACCITAGASWSCELPISSYEWNIVVNFIRRWNKWQFRYVVTILIHAEWRTWSCWSMHPRQCLRRSPPRACVDPTKRLLWYAMLESDGAHWCLWCSCSKTQAGIRWGTLMSLMQLQQNTSCWALVWILCKEINGNIINSTIHYAGLGK